MVASPLHRKLANRPTCVGRFFYCGGAMPLSGIEAGTRSREHLPANCLLATVGTETHYRRLCQNDEGLVKSSFLGYVIPAQAGNQRRDLDSRLRGNDGEPLF